MAIPMMALGLLQAGSSISSAVGQYGAIKSQGMWESGQMERNAELAEFQSREAVRLGEKEAQNKAQQVKKLKGRQRAVAAAQGIEVSDGSALEIQQETAALGALDIATIRNNAWKEAWGYRVEALNQRSNAKFTRINTKYSAKQTLIAGGMAAASSILGAASAGAGGGGGRITGTGSFSQAGVRANTPSAAWVREL